MLFNYSCQDGVEVKPEVKRIQLDMQFIRFDSIFSKANPEDLGELKQNFPFMFKSNVPDSLWKIKMQDTLQEEIENEIFKTFGDFDSVENDIELFYKHLKYFFPEQTEPDVITLAEYVDYRSKIILDRDLLFISLDNYLGADHRFYVGFQDYIAQHQAPHQILPDIAEQYAKRLVPLPKSRDFLSQLIYEGKQLYFKQQTLPLVEPQHIIGYSQEELAWADEFELMVWQYFVERN